jgi:cytochrome c-type biogenesis protein CcmH/NrfG
MNRRIIMIGVACVVLSTTRVAWPDEKKSPLKELTEQAMSLYKNGKTQEAIATLKKAAESYPDAEDPWYFLGQAYAATGDRERALDAYNKAIVINGRNIFTRVQKAVTLEPRRPRIHAADTHGDWAIWEGKKRRSGI